MYGRHHERRKARCQESAALAHHGEALAEQRLPRGGAETHDDLRPHELDLHVQPWHAGCDFARAGALVQAPLAARLPLEMLHDVRDIDGRAVDSGRIERAIEKLSRGAHERAADDVLA